MADMQRHLVIGYKGQVGSALFKILSEKFEVAGIDKEEETTNRGKEYDVLHICILWSEPFVEIVELYKSLLKAGGLTVIHSTVPVGTTRLIGEMNAVHSPIRGVHPHLEEGIRTFVKFAGGIRAGEVFEMFREVGITVRPMARPEATEAAKLWCTTAYGISILVEKVIHAYCEEHGLDFDAVYRAWTETYNEGYEKLGMGHVQRPVLEHVPGRIGGHCVIPNAKILGNWLGDILAQCDEEMFAEEM